MILKYYKKCWNNLLIGKLIKMDHYWILKNKLNNINLMF
jgi:hypothetical protein